MSGTHPPTDPNVVSVCPTSRSSSDSSVATTSSISADSSTSIESSSTIERSPDLKDHLDDIEWQTAYTFSDADSGFGGSSIADSSQYASTVCSRLSSYVYENGRSYHRFREGSYPLPNDEQEIERLELYHHIFQLLLGGHLFTAPLKTDKIRRVLDIGTGTGNWALDYAAMWPHTEVIGNDLSPIQPPWAPENVKFEIDDAESEWTTPVNYFDYIHLRCMSGCFSDWGNVLRQCYEHLAPGGYIEFQDYGAEIFTSATPSSIPTMEDATKLDASSAFGRWWKLTIEAAASTQRPFRVARGMEKLLKEAKFEDVTVTVKIWPVTRWPENKRLDEIGFFGITGMIMSLKSYSLALLTRVYGWKAEDVSSLCKAASEDLIHSDSRYYCQVWFIHGRKPKQLR